MQLLTYIGISYKTGSTEGKMRQYQTVGNPDKIVLSRVDDFALWRLTVPLGWHPLGDILPRTTICQSP